VAHDRHPEGQLIERLQPSAHANRCVAHSEAMVLWAMIGLMTMRLAPTPGRQPLAAEMTLSNTFLVRAGRILSTVKYLDDV
jgi:hypothetical protein